MAEAPNFSLRILTETVILLKFSADATRSLTCVKELVLIRIFLRTLATVFNMARWFGIPTQGGITAICVSLMIHLMLLGLELTAIWKLIRAFGGWSVVKGSVTARLSGAIFYGNSLLSHILSWKFISSWQELSLYWERAEISLEVPLSQDHTIKKKIIIVTGFGFICAVLEHVLSMIATTGLNCPPTEYFRRYILNSHGFLLHSYEYSLWFAIPIFFLSKLATILWNFQDLIIILVCMGLTSRYRRLNSRMGEIIKSENQNTSIHMRNSGNITFSQAQTWRELREAYVRQAELVRRVDEKLGALILLSNLNNLYFICLQLFLGINNEQGSSMDRIYYVLSLSWLISRACCVVLAAADTRIHSLRALSLLQTRLNVDNVEIQRLQTQLKHDTVGIRGMGLFMLDRKLLLTVAATILKYELILIQFDK